MTRTPILLDEDLVRAAQILEETARAIKLSNSVGNLHWVGPPELVKNDRAAHDEMMRIATVLRKHAGYLKPNPLGGPAKVFDTIANRIRAGEDRHAVLDDYGFREVNR